MSEEQMYYCQGTTLSPCGFIYLYYSSRPAADALTEVNDRTEFLSHNVWFVHGFRRISLQSCVLSCIEHPRLQRRILGVSMVTVALWLYYPFSWAPALEASHAAAVAPHSPNIPSLNAQTRMMLQTNTLNRSSGESHWNITECATT